MQPSPSNAAEPISPESEVKTPVSSMEEKKFGSKKMKWVIGVIVALIIILPCVTFLLGVYKFEWQGPFVDRVMRAVPLPAATVNGEWINYAEWSRGVATVNHFYAQKEELGLSSSLPDLTAEQIESNELDRLIEQQLLEDLAAQYQISVSPDEIEVEYTASILPQATNEAEIIETVEKLYGWTLDEFKQEIVREVVLRAKLQTTMNADETFNAGAKQIIDQAKADLTVGQAFSDVAFKYSEDGSAQDGGDLDWIEKGQTVPEFETVAFATAVGATSEIFTSPYGYHILTVLETDEERVHVAHILAKFTTIDEEVVSLKDSAKIKRFVAPETAE